MKETTRRSGHWGRVLHTALPLHDLCSARVTEAKYQEQGSFSTSAARLEPPSLGWHCLYVASRGQHSLTLQQQMLSGLAGPTLLDGTQGHVEDPLHLWLRMGRSLNVRLSSSTRAPGSKDLDVLTTIISHGLIQRRRQYTTHLSVQQPHTSPAHTCSPREAPGS